MHTYTLDLPKCKQRTNQYTHTHIQTPVNVYIYIPHHVLSIFHVFFQLHPTFSPSAPQDWSLLRLPGGVLAAPLPRAEVPEGPGAAARGRGHRGGHGSAWAPPGVGSYKNPWLVMITIII